MSAPHFFASTVASDHVRIDGDDARHALRVLRITPGETITVSDDNGSWVEAVVEPGTDALVARVTARRSIERPTPRVVVYPAVPKAGKLETVVQKLTELGVDEIRPWIAERSVPRWDARKAHANAERWRAVAYEAAKQSRRAFLPLVAEPGPIEQLPPTTVVFHEVATARVRNLPSETGVVGVVVGPEGGLSDAEIDDFERRGCALATLGGSILRAETAAVVGPALILERYGRLG